MSIREIPPLNASSQEEYPISYPEIQYPDLQNIPLWQGIVYEAPPIQNADLIPPSEIVEENSNTTASTEEKKEESAVTQERSRFNFKGIKSCKKVVNAISKRAQTTQQKVSEKFKAINPFKKQTEGSIKDNQSLVLDNSNVEEEETLKIEDFIKEIKNDSLTFEDKVYKCQDILSNQLSRESNPFFYTVLQSTMLNELLAEKAEEYRKYFNTYHNLPADFLDVTEEWAVVIAEALSLQAEGKKEESSYAMKNAMQTSILERVFGSVDNVAKNMDNFLNFVNTSKRETAEDYIAYGAALNQWKTLAWVYNFMSAKPLPFNSEESQEFINQNLNYAPTAPVLEQSPEVMKKEEIATTLDKLQIEEIIEPVKEKKAELKQKPVIEELKIKQPKNVIKKPDEKRNLHPLDISIKNEQAYDKLPALTKYKIFDNIVKGIMGDAEKKAYEYVVGKYLKETKLWERDIPKHITFTLARYRLEASQE